ncbi:MAG: hypothetical protein FP825_04800 [Hyphomonas sp.]|uniref:tetratricopeptide repeat protein n=1 Tax=Hyphomonas sp. TaxID=87 RepID=UPI001823B178|nr:SPOR domain-containing protein [Hyphomonas sp.]MBA3067788.1 hypothetical protein [Hyphomonas sp.]MBU3921060.1 SPOR domain-containing protein [Alphaproteobacteria bacterium]MBU4062124.1 SPOR domain-containing protein [Alphaproteobacteria bacterium]MBU4165559.1 SPOR domain-containing protein [Alphaproteobacteria bacterium]
MRPLPPGRQLSRIGLITGSVVSAIVLAEPAAAQIVQDRFLSRVQASEQGSCSVVTVEFNVPVQYQSHFPETGGRDLRIAVQPLNFNRLSIGASTAAESGRPPSSKIAGIQQITYDVADPAGPTLTLQFDHDVSWDVQADNNVSRIVIRVSNPGSAGCISESGTTGTSASSALADAVLSVTNTLPDAVDPNGNYAVNLASTRASKLDPAVIKQIDAFKDHVGYAYVAEENGATWSRLRLGMFATRSDAEAALADVLPTYPEAWIVRLDRKERDFVYRAWTAARGAQAGGGDSAAPELAINPEAEALLQEARVKFAEGAFADTVRITSAVIAMPKSAASPAAQELLGLAREKAGQLAHAKAEYEAFLRDYPNDPAAGRVRQRLAVLVTGEEAPPTGFAENGEPIREEATKIRAEATGSLSVLYQRDESGFRFQDTPVVGGPEVNPDPVETNQVNLNEILYGADLNLSLGTDRNEALLRFSGLYRDDLNTTDPRDETSISSLYLDLSDRQWNSSLRLGRQTRNSGGVFGRFDGAYGGAQISDRLKLNAVAGYPVQSSRDIEVNSDRVFYGTSADIAVVPDTLDATVYYLTQTYGDLTDREAAGFEFRYFRGNQTAYGVVDYDVSYGQTNLVLLNGTQKFADESSVTVALDYRRSPFLTTQNAIFGQTVTDPNDLLGTYTEDEIYQLAEDRTAYSRSAFISYARPLTSHLQLNLDVVASNVSGTKASGGVDAQPATGTEFYYSAQVVGSDLFKPGAIAILGVRYSELDASTQMSYQFNGRYPVTRSVRISPKIRIDDRQSADGTSSRTSGRGSVAATWTPIRMAQFELEIGGVFSDSQTAFGTNEERGYFFSLGLRKDF